MDSDHLKRQNDEDINGQMALVPSKRARNELVVAGGDNRKALIEGGPKRTSSLEAPIMQLTGHEGEIYCCKFHPSGQTLASAGFDRQIYFWQTYGECENFGMLGGHKGSILDLAYSQDGDYLFSASSDRTVFYWDSLTGARIKKLKGHTGIVNACATSRKGPNLLVTGSDDCKTFAAIHTIDNLIIDSSKIWDMRQRQATTTIKDNYQILAVTFNENADQIVVGGIENVLKVYDLRKNDLLYQMIGHYDSITGLSLSPDGSFVVSNAMDNTLCIWDIRPFAPQDRCMQTLYGHQHNFEKNLLRCSWSPDGTKVTAGSADRFVYCWDTHYRRILYKLPGHLGSVNEVVFHPTEPIILSCSSDKTLYLGEIEN